jgi:predicted XRE-type DNA-binding protein
MSKSINIKDFSFPVFGGIDTECSVNLLFPKGHSNCCSECLIIPTLKMAVLLGRTLIKKQGVTMDFEEYLENFLKMMGKNLHTLRTINNLRQVQISEMLDVSQSQYSKYELGTQEIPTSIILKCSQLFKVDPTFFFEKA